MISEKELDETEISILPLKRKSVQGNDYKYSPKSGEEQMDIVRTSTKSEKKKNINKNQTPEKYSS